MNIDIRLRQVLYGLVISCVLAAALTFAWLSDTPKLSPIHVEENIPVAAVAAAAPAAATLTLASESASDPSSAPEPPEETFPPVADNFPSAFTAASIPAILSANQPPPAAGPHTPTPLFIGFTRNWPILQQAVVSYLTAGWPPSDIYVVDNTGTMDSNKKDLLTLQNPFYMNYTRLHVLGVNVLTTSTLFSFAQLQNYFLFQAIQHGWDHYWWSHMDAVALSWEHKAPYKSLYRGVLDDWEKTQREGKKWGIHYYAYDRLALVNVEAYKDVGGWDTHIPFYQTDCDMVNLPPNHL
jgi:hypothetical protein